MEQIEIKMPILVKTGYLQPNPWNPNHVSKPELDLLEISIRKSGFCFPLIVIKKSDTEYMIVDGYHRHILAKKLKMDVVPVVVLDEPVSELMSATIRFNRAKGTHQVDRMSNVVKEMICLGCSSNEIATNLGMDADEVLRLKQNTGIAELFKHVDYSEVSR